MFIANTVLITDTVLVTDTLCKGYSASTVL